MLETVKKFNEETNELIALTVKEIMGNIDYMDIASMDPKLIDLMIKYMRLMKTAQKIVIEQAETIDRIEEKIDKLISVTGA